MLGRKTSRRYLYFSGARFLTSFIGLDERTLWKRLRGCLHGDLRFLHAVFFASVIVTCDCQKRKDCQNPALRLSIRALGDHGYCQPDWTSCPGNSCVWTVTSSMIGITSAIMTAGVQQWAQHGRLVATGNLETICQTMWLIYIIS